MTQTQVETEYGTLAGARDGDIVVFKGIPFGRPPVGKLRFRPPEPPLPWAGVRDATAHGPSAPQPQLPGMGNVGAFSAPEPHDEDCLYLNVSTPGTDGAKRPVMVWIHGGAFFLGAGSMPWYRGTTLAQRGDVVVVTINYRLGALGFLHLAGIAGEGFAGSGNAAILDQVAALEWVRDNIAAFGGDPGNVTIFGESAGGMSVGTLLGLPAARRLFHRAIPQSGAAHNALTADEADSITAEFMGELGLTTADVEKLLEVPVAKLIDAQTAVTAGRFLKGGMPFQPVADGDVLPAPAIDAIRSGSAADVPVMVGTNLDEMNLFAMMDAELGSLDAAALEARCAERILGGRGGEAPGAYMAARQGTPRDVWLRISTDQVFRIPAVRLAEAQSDHQPDTYMYLFDWCTPAMGGMLGSCHALEIPFVFGTYHDDPMTAMFIGAGPDADRLATTMQGAWLAFARTGSPAGSGLPAWPAYDTTRRATMRVGKECRVEDDPLGAERAWWDGVL